MVILAHATAPIHHHGKGGKTGSSGTVESLSGTVAPTTPSTSCQLVGKLLASLKLERKLKDIRAQAGHFGSRTGAHSGSLDFEHPTCAQQHARAAAAQQSGMRPCIVKWPSAPKTFYPPSTCPKMTCKPVQTVLSPVRSDT